MGEDVRRGRLEKTSDFSPRPPKSVPVMGRVLKHRQHLSVVQVKTEGHSTEPHSPEAHASWPPLACFASLPVMLTSTQVPCALPSMLMEHSCVSVTSRSLNLAGRRSSKVAWSLKGQRHSHKLMSYSPRQELARSTGRTVCHPHLWPLAPGDLPAAWGTCCQGGARRWWRLARAKGHPQRCSAESAFCGRHF